MWLIFLRKEFFPLETKLAIVIPSQGQATGLSRTAEGGISLASRPRSYPDWLTQVSPEHATGILSPKPQFSEIVKTNFNLIVKPKSLITTYFFFFNVLKLLFLPVSEHLSFSLWMEAKEYVCMKILLTGACNIAYCSFPRSATDSFYIWWEWKRKDNILLETHKGKH